MFVPFVEEGWFSGEVVLSVARTYLKPLRDAGVDTVILGCTHYPHLEHIIQNVMGSKVNVISSGEETASEVSTILHHSGLLSAEEEEPSHTFYTTGSKTIFAKIASDWLGKPTTNVFHIELELEPQKK